MQQCSFLADVVYGDSQPVITPMLVNDFTKEIRIVFREDQVMKAHKTTFPITVMVVSGEIDFGIGEDRMVLEAGSVVALEANTIHDLYALKDSIIRLSLHKGDSVARVNGVLKL